MANFALIGYGLAALLFAGFTVLLLLNRAENRQVSVLLFAVLITTLWAGVNGYQAALHQLPAGWIWLLEIFHTLVWLLVLMNLLRAVAAQDSGYARALAAGRYVSWGVAGLMAATLLLPELLGQVLASIGLATDFQLIGQLILVVFGLALIEQLFRNTPEEHRWGVKYLCFGLGAMFAYDFYLYSDALLFHRLDPAIWAARGAVYTMTVPLLVVSATRNPRWSLPLFVSRRVVFHTTAVFAAGVYMLLMALAGYYIRLYGGDWGNVLQIAFLFGAFWILLALLFSGQLRARVKVFFNKHFFNYRYDYREEWLHLIGLLSGQQTTIPLNERVIWALGEIVESPGGWLWICDDAGNCRFTERFNSPEKELPDVAKESGLIRFLEAKKWVINLDEYSEDPGRYDGLDMPAWLTGVDDAWLLVPLIHDERILGFVLLLHPRAKQNLNWENLDLLKTAGMQAASYLALQQAASALAEARQFEGFNRLSAFVMHDLKNLVAQLSLVAKNAARHKHNPDFIDDAVATIENSVAKMNRLMAQLRTARIEDVDRQLTDLVVVVRDQVDRRKGSRPEPRLVVADDEVDVVAEPDRLGAVIGHVIQNAQDATPPDGDIQINLRAAGGVAMLEVIDNGCGMDKAFIEERLFRPFDSTKGLTGMGIGAYECREFVRSLGGRVRVESEPGKGTHFTIILPQAEKMTDHETQTKT